MSCNIKTKLKILEIHVCSKWINNDVIYIFAWPFTRFFYF